MWKVVIENNSRKAKWATSQATRKWSKFIIGKNKSAMGEFPRQN